MCEMTCGVHPEFRSHMHCGKSSRVLALAHASIVLLVLPHDQEAEAERKRQQELLEQELPMPGGRKGGKGEKPEKQVKRGCCTGNDEDEEGGGSGCAVM